MYIKIQTERELTLLSRLNSWLGKNRIPLELLECAENLLKPRLLGKKGFVAIVPNVTEGELSHIQELLNVGHELEVQGVAERIEVADKGRGCRRKGNGIELCSEWENATKSMFCTQQNRKRGGNRVHQSIHKKSVGTA